MTAGSLSVMVRPASPPLTCFLRARPSATLDRDAGVYDVTEFLAVHPGGRAILAGVGGTDATTMFETLHDATILEEIAAPYRLGALDEVVPTPATHPVAATLGDVAREDAGVDEEGTEAAGVLDPKERFPPHFPKAMRWLAARWEPACGAGATNVYYAKRSPRGA